MWLPTRGLGRRLVTVDKPLIIRPRNGKKIPLRQQLFHATSRGQEAPSTAESPYKWLPYKAYKEMRADLYPQGGRSTTVKARAELCAQPYRPPMSSADLAVEQQLRDRSTRPIDILQKHIVNGNASQNVVRLCLNAQYEELQKLPRGQRHTICDIQREEQFARTILAHILQNRHAWTAFLGREFEATFQLCLFATIEGIEDIVLKWLRMVEDEGFGPWRSTVVRSLIKAQSFLTLGLSADSFLNMYFSMADMLSVRPGQRAARMVHHESERSALSEKNVRAGAVIVQSLLWSNENVFGWWQTDPSLYDQFMTHTERKELEYGIDSPPRLAWIQSRLHLFHPRILDHIPAMRILEEYAKNGLSAYGHSSEPAARELDYTVPAYIRRTADVAEANEDMTAARWIFRTLEKEYEMAPVLPLHRAQGQLRHLQRVTQSTPMHLRLFNAATRVGGPKPSHVSQHIVQPTVEVSQSPAAHAKKSQSTFETSPKDTKKSAQLQLKSIFKAAPGQQP